MIAQPFKPITPKDLPDYEDRADEIAVGSWPEFMLHDEVANRNWHDLFDRFEEYQFAMLDTESNYMAESPRACGRSDPQTMPRSDDHPRVA